MPKIRASFCIFSVRLCLLDHAFAQIKLRRPPPDVRFTPKADIGTQPRNVRFVPVPDIQEFATCTRLNPDYGTVDCWL